MCARPTPVPRSSHSPIIETEESDSVLDEDGPNVDNTTEKATAHGAEEVDRALEEMNSQIEMMERSADLKRKEKKLEESIRTELRGLNVDEVRREVTSSSIQSVAVLITE